MPVEPTTRPSSASRSKMIGSACASGICSTVDRRTLEIFRDAA
jgi:hypothetical protein